MASERPLRRRWRRFAFLAVICGLIALAIASPFADPLARLGVDLALPAARALAPPAPASKVALIVIDGTTHAARPFDQTPEVAWTPYLARVLDAVAEARPKVVGLDVIYPKTLALPDLAPGFDRPFLAALARLGRSGQLVLSQVRLSDRPIVPYMGQQIAVGGPANIRSVHLLPDVDDVLRAQPVAIRREDGRSETTFAVELARRAGAAVPAQDYLIDFRPAPDRFPAWRLSDLYACAAAGRTEAFAPFRGKVVLVGYALDVEDRRLAADRFTAAKTPVVRATPCGPGGAVHEPRRPSTPGVMIVARAIDTLLAGAPLKPLPRPAAFAGAWALLFGFGALTLRAAPAAGAAALALAGVAAWGAGALALAHGSVLPWTSLAAGAVATLLAAQAYRVVIEDAARRRIAHAFGHYVSPALVNRLAEHPEQLKLGGERRRVGIMFTDLAGFTPFASQNPPEAVVAQLNAIFSVIGETVEAAGGYVDKFIGDGVMAIWGAPEASAQPEAAAAHAALACLSEIEKVEGALPLRIGLASGDVIAGNVGARRRFDYTVIGETVNEAARLEELNKTYGTRILMDGAFCAGLPDGFRSRLLGRVTPRGMSREIEVHELLGYDQA